MSARCLPVPEQPLYLGHVLGHQEMQPRMHEDELTVPYIVLEVMLKIQAEHKNTHPFLILLAGSMQLWHSA